MLKLIHRLRSDEALIQAYRRGDAGAFECLYARHKDALFAFLYQHCPRQAVVEELAQDAWIGVIDGVASWQPRAKFRTWLYRIARNRLVDYLRRRDNSHLSLESCPAAEPAVSNPEQASLEQQVLAAVGELPLEQRDVVLLREQGFSLAEIASITGAGQEAVKSRLRYARKTLRQRLGDLT